MFNACRERDLRTIADLYGTEGLGLQLLLEVAPPYLLAMLPDRAIAELAQRHLSEEHRQQLRLWDV
jgi:hypothetical protein